METLVALVDYDNVIPLQEKTVIDQQLNLDALMPALVAFVEEKFKTASELHVRLYGGWVSEVGTYSERASWMLSQLHNYKRRFQNIYVRPSLVVSLVDSPHLEVLGTLRGARKRQKMVDTLMTTDIVTLSSLERYPHLLIVSSDDDLVPGIIKARQSSPQTGIYILRSCQTSRLRCNDRLLKRCGTWIHSFGEYL